MKGFVVALFVLTALGAVLYFLNPFKQDFISPLASIIPEQRPLAHYSYENLKNTNFLKSPIVLGREIGGSGGTIEQMFYFKVPAKPNKSPSLTVSGVINTPNKLGIYPIIVMFRGYMDREIYKPGDGTEPSAKVFADNGFITIAPDFLGYGESASPSADGFEERFQTYTTAMTLLASLPNLNQSLEASYSGIKADLSKIGIWGHSNGGQIALSVLEIGGFPYPTILWAPVSKSFPYSILYYTDETDDQGKALRKALSKFENDYNTDLFSLTKHLNWIKAPIEIHQGSADEEVPIWWSHELVKQLKENKIDVKYFTYPNADHNLLPGAWSNAVTTSISFFNSFFRK